jgi:HK97 family phage prohead protease
MPTKTCAVRVKATAADDSSLAEGQFTALASVFNNIDAVGDVVMPGAFADDLKAWKASGDPIPLLWGHQMADPDMNLGEVLEAKETDTGLQIRAQLDLDNPKAAQVYKLLKGKRVSKMSFAYDIEDGAPAERDGTSVYELRKLKLHEVSVVQIPANPAATIQQVKAAADRRKARLKDATTDPQLAVLLGQADQAIDSAMDAVTAADAAMDEVLDLLKLPDPDADEAAEDGGDPAAPPKNIRPAVKAGRTLSAKNESALRKALDQITAGMTDVKSVLDSLETSDDGKANPAQPATAEEPSGVKTDSPATRYGPASTRLLACLAAECAEAFTD